MEIEYIASDMHQIYFARGHVDLDEFKSELLKEDDENIEKFGKPKHVYYRARPDNTGDYSCWYYEVDKGGRGAFPVTRVFRNW